MPIKKSTAGTVSMTNNVEQFAKLFQGRTDAYGLYDGKNYKTVKGRLTTEHYKQHLDGQISLGVIPINTSNKCNVGIIDDDPHHMKENYKYDYDKLLKKINLLKLPVNVFQSKSGGAHIVMFLPAHEKAADVRHIMKKFAYQLCDDKFEIFPKQDTLGATETGNFINLPYHNGNSRVMINAEGKQLNFDDAMLYGAKRRIKLENTEVYKLLGPKDLDGGRNKRLFSATNFFKKHFPNDWKDKVKDYNKLFTIPLDDKEVKQTVISSVSKKDYFDNQWEEEITELVAHDLMQYRSLDIKKPLWILEKIIKERTINFLFGEKGKGKTEFALGFLFAISKGLPFLNYKAEYCHPCTWIDGEMDPYDAIERTTPYIDTFGPPPKNYLQIINFALQKDQVIPDIKDELGQELILKHLKKQELMTGKKPFLVLDNLRSLSNYIENDADSYRPIGVWLKNLRGLGYTILVIDHTGKAAPGPRGTSSKTDWANVCLKIEPDGPAGQKFMKVKLSFDKARGLKPDETGDYVCAYDFQGNWRLASSSKELEDQEYIKQIKQLMEHEPKITQKAIADKLDISVGKVNKLIKQMNSK